MDQDVIFDVVIFKTSNQIDHDRAPIRNRFDLSSDLWIGILPRDLSKVVFKACEPAGYNFEPVRQFEQLYSFVRENPPQNDRLQWDPDQRLQLCLALSRIVHPTSVSFEYAARIISNSQGALEKVVPGPVSGPGSTAYVCSPQFDCLMEKNCTDLKQLLDSYVKTPLIEPVKSALWYHEFAARTYEVDIRWTIIATGLEALVHTDRYNSTRQFVTRIQELAKKIGAKAIKQHEAKEMYELRSSLAHGAGLGSLTPQKSQLYEKMESLLRRIVKRSILDPALAAFLADREKIRSIWPIGNAK